MATLNAPRSLTQVGGPSLTRRTALKGMAGVVGVVTVPTLLAACGASTDGSPAAPGGTQAGSPAASSVPIGTVSLGSNFSDAAPKAAMQAVADRFTAATDIRVAINTVDRDNFQHAISSYLQGTPDEVLTWAAGYRMRYFADKGLLTDISDVWSLIGANMSEGFKTASTGDDGKQYFVPFYNYPWVIIYRKSLFEEKGYAIPTTFDDLKGLADRMIVDGIVPFAFGDSEGWPAMGTFDILNMRLNGYDFHVGLMAGTEKWADSKVKQVFEKWRELLPYHQVGALGRTWQEAAQSMVSKEAGMFFLGTFAGEQAADPSAHDDLDIFPFPLLGTQHDAESAIDAPIDGFMLSKEAVKNLDAAKAFAEYLASGEAQIEFLVASPNNVAAANDADTSGYSALQKRAAEIIASSNRIAQFLDRDTRQDFAGPNGMQAFIQTFLQDPDRDLDAYLASVQAFYDSLGPET